MNLTDPEMLPMRAFAGLLSPAGQRARLSILIYHRVLPEPDPMLGDPDASRFRWQMETLKRLFHPLPLSEGVARLAAGTLPARAVCITFDDGYADNLEVALPILQELEIPATFFVAAGYLDGGIMFNDLVIETLRRIPTGEWDLSDAGLGLRTVGVSVEERSLLAQEVIGRVKHLDAGEREARVRALAQRSPSPLPGDLMMTSAQLRRLASAGMEIGGHTRTHPILARLNDEQAREEIRSGREILESLLREPVRVFAYPNGKPGDDFDARHVEMVRQCGFSAAVSTAWGVSTQAVDTFQMPRFTPWDQTPLRFAGRLIRNLLNTQPVVA